MYELFQLNAREFLRQPSFIPTNEIKISYVYSNKNRYNSIVGIWITCKNMIL